MARWKIRIGTWIVWLVAGQVPVVSAITPNQLDDFEDGATMGWSQGARSPTPPMNVPDGGPAGAGDHYLENVSSGGFSSGGRMTLLNESQWTGDYTSAGVSGITADMANLGTNDLAIRLAVGSGSTSQTSTWYASQDAINLPADGVWRSVFFELSVPNLALVNEANTLENVLTDVTQLRILSAAGGPAFEGDHIAGTLGVDNITAQLLGDLDCDGDIDVDDVDPFVQGITDAVGYQAAFGVPPSLKGDVDRDGDSHGRRPDHCQHRYPVDEGRHGLHGSHGLYNPRRLKPVDSRSADTPRLVSWTLDVSVRDLLPGVEDQSDGSQFVSVCITESSDGDWVKPGRRPQTNRASRRPGPLITADQALHC